MGRAGLLDDEAAGTAPKGSHAWAWGICWLMFASTILNYMDRQSVSVVGERVTKEFGIGFEQLGWVIAAFQLSYALFQVPAGYVADRLDVRWTYAGAVLWWSLAAVAVALAPTLGLLMAARAVLGFGESFNWPCALRVTATVLPPADRGLGNGIFNSGAAVGAVLTPLVIAPLTIWGGWRLAFAAVGGAGLVWVAAWLVATGGERRGLFAGRAREERDSTREGLAPATAWSFAGLGLACVVGAGAGFGRFGLSAIWWGVAGLMVGLLILARVLTKEMLRGSDFTESLGCVVRLRRFWVMAVVSISINVCWHFLVNWLPTYLKTDRGMTFVAGSLLSSVPFLAADLGNLGGGALARALAGRGLDPAAARLRVLAGCVALISAGAWVGMVKHNGLTILLLGLMALGTAAFMANYFAYCQEVAPGHTGLVVGILGGLGNLFAAGFAPIAGRVKDTSGGFGPIFVVVGLLPFVGLGALWLGWGRDRPGAEAA